MYQLIMMEYDMPVLNGAETAIRISSILIEKRVSESSHPYIICMSNLSYVGGIKVNCEKAGMHGFVSKPIFKLAIYKLLVQAKLLNVPTL